MALYLASVLARRWWGQRLDARQRLGQYAMGFQLPSAYAIFAFVMLKTRVGVGRFGKKRVSMKCGS